MGACPTPWLPWRENASHRSHALVGLSPIETVLQHFYSFLWAFLETVFVSSLCINV